MFYANSPESHNPRPLHGVPKLPDMGTPATITAHLMVIIEPPALKTCDISNQRGKPRQIAFR
jgi:hypothetical protein